MKLALNGALTVGSWMVRTLKSPRKLVKKISLFWSYRGTSEGNSGQRLRPGEMRKKDKVLDAVLKELESGKYTTAISMPSTRCCTVSANRAASVSGDGGFRRLCRGTKAGGWLYRDQEAWTRAAILNTARCVCLARIALFAIIRLVSGRQNLRKLDGKQTSG